MTATTTSASAILAPEQVGPLLVQPALAASIAAQVSTRVVTTSHIYRIPVVAADPTASWVAEGAEISPSDMTLTELDVVPAKVAGLSIVTRELAEDTDPAAAQVVGDGLARDIARKVDQAFFSTMASPAPAGLPSLTPSTITTSGTAFDSLDQFAAALAAAEQVGAVVTSFVTSPAEALALATLKESTTSSRPLLGADPTAPTQRTVYGVPLYVSPYVAAKTVWAIPADRVFVVVRADARIEVDGSVFFTSDRVAVKATMRASFGFAHAAAVVKITHA